MDANAVYDPDGTATQHTLEYMNASLTVSPQHDGNFSTLVTTCNLCLPLAHQHTIRPFPASHISGRNQIDYIFVSKSILPAVLHFGVLSHHSLTKGDHRPYYLDFDASILFSDPAYNIEPATVQRLRLQDPRIVQQYTQTKHPMQFTGSTVDPGAKNLNVTNNNLSNNLSGCLRGLNL